MRKNPQAGVTLIEILIAVTLLSLLSAGILTAMRLGLSTMDRTDARMVRNRRVTSARRIIENEIAGMIETMALAPMPTGQRAPVQFFQAEPGTMRFVTAYSLADAWRGKPQIAALQVVPGERGEGVRLIVNEATYTGPAQTGELISSLEPTPSGMFPRFSPVMAGDQSFVLADRLRSCSFTYLEHLPVAPFDLWRPVWPFTQRLPAGVRIDMAPLDANSAELRATSLTIPINLTVPSGANYAGQ